MPRAESRTLGARAAALTLNLALGIATGLTILLVGSALHRMVVAEPPAPPPPVLDQPVRAEVLNGCGAPGAASAVASLLRAAGAIDVVEIGNTQGLRVERSLVLDRVGRRDVAERVAATLDIDEVLLQRLENGQVHVTVIVGYDGGRWERALDDR